MRYAPLVKQTGATVLLDCQKPLLKLLAESEGIDRFVPQGEVPLHYDVSAPLLSLPMIFNTKIDTKIVTVPAQPSYLRADQALTQRWRQTLASFEGLKVGIC